ncbi:amiloride-sensitive sodium channel subunit alpha-like [Paramuricea clavata]|uniref:Amiloride-sensitive sodium channel subunit alpha-like n=1 Tax=Paramuricea clavata TaxID=317549 RepID=A0A7D9JYS5_PARCT|nr:amiloride-sensitive sodium channel subunit alpha-like [Paramuricea clavata]
MIKNNRLPNELSDVFTSNETSQKVKYTEINITRDNKDKTEGYGFDYSEYAADEQTKENLENNDDYAEISEEYPDKSDVGESTKLRQAVDLLIGSVDVRQLYDNGHSMEDLIKSCSWKGLNCKNGKISKHWTQSWNYKYGNCYTFNNGVDKDKNPMRILKASKPGPSHGLTLQLDIEQSLYIGALTQGAGVRVTLHEQGVMPFPYEDGFSVAPGMATSVGLRKTVIKRLDGFNRRDCLTDPTPSKKNIYRIFSNITNYSQQACLNSCLGKTQWFTCGCSESAYPSGNIPCDAFNTKESKILLHVVNNIYSGSML